MLMKSSVFREGRGCVHIVGAVKVCHRGPSESVQGPSHLTVQETGPRIDRVNSGTSTGSGDMVSDTTYLPPPPPPTGRRQEANQSANTVRNITRSHNAQNAAPHDVGCTTPLATVMERPVTSQHRLTLRATDERLMGGDRTTSTIGAMSSRCGPAPGSVGRQTAAALT